ncbi:hypothetical protein ABTN37_18495, partial [Acinetobacter baumannii]
KDDLEAVGLMKVDVLALGMLTAIRKTLQSLAAYADTHPASPATGPGPIPRSVADIPPEDPATYDMLCRG